MSGELVTRPTTAPQESGSDLASPRRQAVLLVLLLITSALSYTWIRTRDLERVVTVDEPVFLRYRRISRTPSLIATFARPVNFFIPPCRSCGPALSG